MATIVQQVRFKNTTAAKLYALYMNAKLHGMITASPVKVSAEAGGRLEAFGGYIKGKTLAAVKDRLVAQAWRGSDWKSTDKDSVLVLSFEQSGKDAILHMTHANVPAEHAKGLSKGWHDHYWSPWKQHLAGKTITRPEN